MGIKFFKKSVVMVSLILLLPHCKKTSVICLKEGYEYINTTSQCWYTPGIDSIPVGTVITLVASVPKNFNDEVTNTTVANTSSIISGSLGIGMIYPTFQGAADSFELTSQIGKVIKDTINFSSGILKGFRTIEWDGSSIDSFKTRLSIKALSRGIYSLSLKQQGYKDRDCARYKYFLKVGNSDQHLNYWFDATGNISDEVRYYAYCFKVY